MLSANIKPIEVRQEGDITSTIATIRQEGPNKTVLDMVRQTLILGRTIDLAEAERFARFIAYAYTIAYGLITIHRVGSFASIAPFSLEKTALEMIRNDVADLYCHYLEGSVVDPQLKEFLFQYLQAFKESTNAVLELCFSYPELAAKLANLIDENLLFNVENTRQELNKYLSSLNDMRAILPVHMGDKALHAQLLEAASGEDGTSIINSYDSFHNSISSFYQTLAVARDMCVEA